jgi:hypothetical protein
MNQKRRLRFAAVGVQLVLLLCVVSCNRVHREEIARARSPDSLVDAVLIRSSSGGATTGFGYEVYVVPAGAPCKPGEEVMRADQTENIALHWVSAKLLRIEFDDARIFHFENFWISEAVENFNYVVKLYLKQKGKE